MNTDIIAFEQLLSAQEVARFTFWIMIGTWVAGVATSLAVMITLYVTYNQKRVRLSCDISEREIVGGLSSFFDDGQNDKGISFNITNNSVFPVTLSKVGMSNACFPWQKKKYFFLNIDIHQHSNKLPMKLESGEQCHFWIPLNEKGDEWFEYMAGVISSAGLTPNKMRIVVSTTFGGSPRFKYSNDILRKLNSYKRKST
ncbi:hypothetical protein O3T12_18110 [Serratia marcescens]|uniref:hypothetical protein n=1 Tax=Serratia marcescens TaxID=615 RepID=UPI000A9BEBA8|nr:hypothetical protein [Serratia marcescens]MBH2978187.1 hypothetical protein [Serratia marcescens]MBN5328130.1 hypothetical protein [Serratia marcescens]MBN5351778.1 hypothetical protein [Serratia marcescens]MDU0858614.1 hypothetical protein [Serratia marcescens]WAZ05098.1 hypothetical protein O3T12_18110 [Serratia marcescens]